MPETRAEKTEYLRNQKWILVTSHGCYQCKEGQDDGFARYWYEPRRFVFKYFDKRESDIPVAKLSRYKSSTLKSIDEALSRCVILCRSCADPRRTRKEITQCPAPAITTLQSDS